jgi:hypothetical protein
MIPSFEQRQIRDCGRCVFYHDECEYYHPDYCAVRDDVNTKKELKRRKSDKCKYCYTDDEIKELLDNL